MTRASGRPAPRAATPPQSNVGGTIPSPAVGRGRGVRRLAGVLRRHQLGIAVLIGTAAFIVATGAIGYLLLTHALHA